MRVKVLVSGLRHWHSSYNVLLVLAAVYDDQHFMFVQKDLTERL